jgi:hypothetical protein
MHKWSSGFRNILILIFREYMNFQTIHTFHMMPLEGTVAAHDESLKLILNLLKDLMVILIHYANI